MKLHGFRFKETGGGNDTHVHVTGRMEVEHTHKGKKGTVLIPINYKSRAEDPPEKHEKILKDLEAKAKIFAERHHEFHPWQGAKETHGDATIEIIDCALQHFGPNDWKLYVSWKETIGGRTSKLSKLFTYETPLQAMPLEQLQAMIRGEVAARSAVKVNLDSHKEALRAIHLAHSEEAHRVRTPGGQGDPGGGGPPERPGKGK